MMRYPAALLTFVAIFSMPRAARAADEPNLDKLPPAAARAIDFAKEVQPLLETRCVKCHSGEKPKGKFSLQTSRLALESGESGANVLPGKSSQSRLIHYVAGIVDDFIMPPKDAGPRLNSDQVAILRAWIDQGAKWPDALTLKAATPLPDKRDHWAFRPPVRPALPEVHNPAWIRGPLDRFILSRLEQEKLPPSVEADRATLIRRLSLDLIGLPPTPAEVDAFLADADPSAYEKLVERLLASPHYGERWGRHWLDAARYADSDGYEKDKARQVWFYRDWVVQAHNRDLPYNRFIIEQLAGDLIPGANQDSITATGFLRNSMLNEEGGVDPEQFRMDAMFDRMDAIGKSVLGLTIQCCQCHSHKFDPMTQEEYYRLFAFLNNDSEAQRVVYRPDEQQKIDELRRKIAAIDARLREVHANWRERMMKWEAKVRGDQPAWTVVALENMGDNGQRYIPQKDGSILAQGYAPTKFTTHMRATAKLPVIRSFRLELLNDPNLPCNGPGRSFKGTSALSEFTVEATDVRNPKTKIKVKLSQATADFGNAEQPLEPNYDDRSGKKRVTGPINFAIDGKDDTAWGIDAGPGRRNQPRVAVFVSDKPIEFPDGAILDFHLKQNHGGWNSDDNMNHNLGRFRLSVTGVEATADPVPPRVRNILSIPWTQRTPGQIDAVFAHWRTTVPEFKEENEQIEALWKQWPEGATTLTLQAREEMRMTQVLRRGDFLKPVRPVSAGVPEFLHSLHHTGSVTRQTLAEWLVDPRSPTTARVFVNRVWQAYFGTGLVVSSEDFGTQSDKPSHPELLDWLAVEFMEDGWSIKNLHRRIVTSATYRQSSKVSPELLERDPNNRLMARGARLRVEGEVVRDIALAASGLLNRTVGGPSIFAPAPAFLFVPPASYGPFNWIEVTGADRYRRALYTFRRRSTPYPALQNFDVPNADFSCVRRPRSNTPLQALTTLNETIFLECARAMGLRILREGGATDSERVTYALRLAVGRTPTNDEVADLLHPLESQRKRLVEKPADALLIATGQADPKLTPKGFALTDVAAYTLLARVVLNLDETITRE